MTATQNKDLKKYWAGCAAQKIMTRYNLVINGERVMYGLSLMRVKQYARDYEGATIEKV